MQIEIGDSIHVLSEADDGWCMGECHTKLTFIFYDMEPLFLAFLSFALNSLIICLIKPYKACIYL